MAQDLGRQESCFGESHEGCVVRPLERPPVRPARRASPFCLVLRPIRTSFMIAMKAAPAGFIAEIRNIK